MIVLIGYGIAQYTVLYPYRDIDQDTMSNVFYWPYFQAFGDSHLDGILELSGCLGDQFTSCEGPVRCRHNYRGGNRGGGGDNSLLLYFYNTGSPSRYFLPVKLPHFSHYSAHYSHVTYITYTGCCCCSSSGHLRPHYKRPLSKYAYCNDGAYL